MALNYDDLNTLTLAGDASGYVKDLGAKYVSLTARIDDSGGECWVRAAKSPASAPSAPGSTPAPAAKALSAKGWVHLKGAGSSFTWPVDPFGFRQYVEVWDVAAGGVILDGTQLFQQ